MKKYTGGLRWGGKSFFSQRNVSFPMASLWINQGEVALKAPTVEFHIPRGQILRTEIKNRILYKGIVIAHAAPDVPETLIFWTRNADEILSQLSAASLDVVAPERHGATGV